MLFYFIYSSKYYYLAGIWIVEPAIITVINSQPVHNPGGGAISHFKNLAYYLQQGSLLVVN